MKKARSKRGMTIVRVGGEFVNITEDGVEVSDALVESQEFKIHLAIGNIEIIEEATNTADEKQDEEVEKQDSEPKPKQSNKSKSNKNK